MLLAAARLLLALALYYGYAPAYGYGPYGYGYRRAYYGYGGYYPRYRYAGLPLSSSLLSIWWLLPISWVRLPLRTAQR